MMIITSIKCIEVLNMSEDVDFRTRKEYAIKVVKWKNYQKEKPIQTSTNEYMSEECNS